MTTLWMKAASYAAHKHRHQIRRDGKTPYIAHPFRVAMIVRDLFETNDEEVIAAALLHDTIEDTATDYDDVKEFFGVRVADMVSALTKDMRLPDAKRESEYDRQLAEGPWEARLIKLADVYDNITDAPTSNIPLKYADKVKRAVALARGDDRLELAARKLLAQGETMMAEADV
jgi:(p)ppGpp synthase/HD superfamily hydrolase